MGVSFSGLPGFQAAPSSRAVPLGVRVCAATPPLRAQVGRELGAIVGVRRFDRTIETPDVLLYAAYTPRELVALLGSTREAAVPSLFLDLGGAVGAGNAALLGLLGYLSATATRSQWQYGLQEVARGWPYVPEPFDGLFHATRAAGCLTAEQKRILRLAGRGYTQEQMQAALGLTRSTLHRRVRALKQRLGLGGHPLIVGALQLGFVPEASPLPLP